MIEQVQHQQSAGQQSTNARQPLDDFCTLMQPNNARKNSQHSIFRTVGNRASRRLFCKQAAITRTIRRGEHAHLPFKPRDTAVHERNTKGHTSIVDGVTRWEIIRAIKHDVVLRDYFLRVVERNPRVMQLHTHQRIDVLQPLLRRIELARTNIAAAIQQLSMQVALVDHVNID